MLKISEPVADMLSIIDGIGHFSKFGAIIGEDEFVIYYPDESDDIYLAHISEFETQGVLVRLKEKNV